MSPQPSRDRFPSLEKITTVFHVGPHVLKVSKVNEGRWTFAVDDAEGSSSFPTQAAAWEAGIRAADHLDAPRAR